MVMGVVMVVERGDGDEDGNRHGDGGDHGGGDGNGGGYGDGDGDGGGNGNGKVSGKQAASDLFFLPKITSTHVPLQNRKTVEKTAKNVALGVAVGEGGV